MGSELLQICSAITRRRSSTAGVRGRAACRLCRRGAKRRYVTPSSPPHPSPLLHPLILLQATGQVSRHWLHLLHLGCLAFFSSPKWSCKFHVAGRVTDREMGASKWEIRRGAGTSELHNGALRPALDPPASCHLQFGLINPCEGGESLVSFSF